MADANLLARFNGAALRRVRKRRPDVTTDLRAAEASMEPHSVECGNAKLAFPRCAIVELQWSRTP